MFSVSEGSSDIFGNGRTSSLVFGNLRQYSGIVGSLRKSSEIIRNCVKWPKTPSYTKQNNIGLIGAVFASFWEKSTVSKNFLLLALNCLKFICFMLQSQKMKCLVLSMYLYSYPLLIVIKACFGDIIKRNVNLRIKRYKLRI